MNVTDYAHSTIFSSIIMGPGLHADFVESSKATQTVVKTKPAPILPTALYGL